MDKINEILKNGGVIAFVTDTVWGLGCLPTSQRGVEKIYEIKSREKEKPLILMSDTVENLLPYVKEIPQKAQELIDKYFPGALTIILEKSDKTPLTVTSGKNTVGIRVPDNKVFQKICSQIDGGVLATTSANFSHEPSSKNYKDVVNSVGHLVDYVVEDESDPAKGLESTVVLVLNDEIKILRQGEIKF